MLVPNRGVPTPSFLHATTGARPALSSLAFNKSMSRQPRSHGETCLVGRDSNTRGTARLVNGLTNSGRALAVGFCRQFRFATAPQYSVRVLDADLTTTLNTALKGDKAAAERAWSDAYADVRAIAARAISQEHAANPDLHPTGLVHDIFLRIDQSPPGAWANRRHFFGAVSRACEQSLIDRARVLKARKRGGGRIVLPLPLFAHKLPASKQVQGSHDAGLCPALERLRTKYPRAAEVVFFRYALEISTPEIARMLSVSESTVEKDCTFARAWLLRELEEDATRAHPVVE